MIIMNTKENSLKELKIKFTYIQCPNCNGYGTKGFNHIICPSCKGIGVLEVPLKEEDGSENIESV